MGVGDRFQQDQAMTAALDYTAGIVGAWLVAYLLARLVLARRR